MARRFGPAHTPDPATDDVVEAVRSLTTGDGADYAFEAAGRTELVTQAFGATRRGGTIVAVGVAGPAAQVILPGPRLSEHPQTMELLISVGWLRQETGQLRGGSAEDPAAADGGL
jgi:threonine dehydrogenase-like Zn-dependent dehydrogenase